MLNKALLALVIVGSSSTAFAHPTGRDHQVGSHYEYYRNGTYDRFDDQGRYRDLGRSDSRWNRGRASWMELSSPTRVSDEREGRAFINIDSRTPMMSKLRLEQVEGATYVLQVAVELADGQGTIKARPEVVLDRGRPTLTVNLGGYHKVNRVVVYGSNYSGNSSFALQGA